MRRSSNFIVLNFQHKGQKILFFLLLLALFGINQCSVPRDFFTSHEIMHGHLLETRDCQEIQAPVLLPAEALFVKTALATFPRSGNGWMRTMIERSFGYLTSSKYTESQGESSPNMFLLKTHDPLFCKECRVHTERALFNQVIMIVRNPFDSFASYLFFQHRGQPGSNATFDQEYKRALVKRLDRLCQQLLEFDRFWTRIASPTLVFRYEDLTQPRYMRQALQRIREFLIISPMNGRKRLHGIQKFLEITDFRINCTIEADTSIRSITHYGVDLEYRKQILSSLSYYSSQQITKILTVLSDYLCKYKYQGLLAQSGLYLSCPPTPKAHIG